MRPVHKNWIRWRDKERSRRTLLPSFRSYQRWRQSKVRGMPAYRHIKAPGLLFRLPRLWPWQRYYRFYIPDNVRCRIILHLNWYAPKHTYGWLQTALSALQVQRQRAFLRRWHLGRIFQREWSHISFSQWCRPSLSSVFRLYKRYRLRVRRGWGIIWCWHKAEYDEEQHTRYVNCHMTHIDFSLVKHKAYPPALVYADVDKIDVKVYN